MPSQMARTEDRQLLSRFVNDRDEDAFAVLVRKYQKLVWSVCHQVLSSRADVEDSFQETFLALAKNANRIRKPGSLASWLYGTAYRVSISMRRKQRAISSLDEANDMASAYDVLDLVARRNERELVCEELLHINERLRSPLLLHYYGGKSTASIAATLDLTVAAVESRLRRGRSALRLRLLKRGICCATVFAILELGMPSAVASEVVQNTICNSLLASSAKPLGLADYVSTINQTGVKLMICKSIAVFAITGLLGIGIAIHTPTQPTLSVTAENSANEFSFEVLQEEDDERSPSLVGGLLSNAFAHIHRIHDRAFAPKNSREQLMRLETLESPIVRIVLQPQDLNNDAELLDAKNKRGADFIEAHLEYLRRHLPWSK